MQPFILRSRPFLLKIEAYGKLLTFCCSKNNCAGQLLI